MRTWLNFVISPFTQLCSAALILLAMSLASNAAEGEAAVVNGNMLFTVCENPSDVTQSFCSGYVIGLLEGTKFGAFMSYGSTNGNIGDEAASNAYVEFVLGFCIPEDVEYGQILDVFVKYLRENPETRHLSARSLFVRSMSSTFVCE